MSKVNQSPNDLKQNDRQLFAATLQKLADEMRTELDTHRNLLLLVSKGLAECKTVGALRGWLTDHEISVCRLLGWHNRFPDPAVVFTKQNQKQIAARATAKEDKQLSEILSNPSKWLGDYATQGASMIGDDRIPKIARAFIFACKNALIGQPRFERQGESIQRRTL